ncbi:hypothetical protein AWB64_06138 [Caballeronia sordidicola]|uniref:Uncharacterized protein n=1 Tax=Caballeronia sordidicola TaxID=196367 RepID=A0A158IGX1_CABSO|nr:hypothetical protein [Caballeronia sordidicola]SAL55539.1 hypothetical protein AWB64_06138 [Caballeronia sordidicola]
MTTELMRYEGHRFLLYKKWDYAPNGRTPEQTKALEAGKALFKAANFEHWASQPELVARVQKFLVESVPSYRASPYGDRPGDIIKALCWEVRNEAVVIVRAKPEYIAHDGFVPKREFDYAAYKRDQDERGRAYMARSKAYSDDLKAYNKAIDDRIRREANALKPYRHIETVTEAGERNLAAWAKCDALAALASAASMVASSLPSRDDDVFDLGEVSEIGSGSTPLGDAAPFEYVKNATSNDVMSIAARGVSESHEAECFAEYETDLELCNFAGALYNDPRTYAMCKQRAFSNYQACRGY